MQIMESPFCWFILSNANNGMQNSSFISTEYRREEKILCVIDYVGYCDSTWPDQE